MTGVGRLALLALLALLGCRHGVTPLAPNLEAALAVSKDSHLAGAVSGLEEFVVMNRRDFVYALALAPVGGRVAFSHLNGADDFRLAVQTPAAEPAQGWEADLNPYSHDVEGVAFSPDGAVVVTASRDGVGRFFSARNGQPLGRFASQEPLTRVTFHPNGRYVLFGSARGGLMAVRFPALTFAGEIEAHAGELQGLAAGPDGTVYTGGWDRTLAAWTTAEQAMGPEVIRLPVERRNGLALLRGEVNGAPLTMAVDARAPYLFITLRVARAAGIDPARIHDSVPVEGPMGTLGVKRVRNARVVLKGIVLENVDVAICDVCVSSGIDGVLGAPLFEQAEVHWEGNGSLVLAPRAALRSATLTFTQRYRVDLGGYANDVSIDAEGKWLGVALSPQRAERSKLIYDREKRGDFGRQGPESAGLVMSARDGQVKERFVGHAGVVATAAISPDGASLATGGWDRTLRLYRVGEERGVQVLRLGGAVRRVRFSPDGRWLGVAAWTPPRVGDSDPSAIVYGVRYGPGARVVP